MRIGKFLLTVFLVNLLTTFVLGSIISGGSLEDNGAMEILAMFIFTVITILLMLPALFFLYVSEKTNKIIGLLLLHFLLLILLYFLGYFHPKSFYFSITDGYIKMGLKNSDIIDVYLGMYLGYTTFFYFMYRVYDSKM